MHVWVHGHQHDGACDCGEFAQEVSPHVDSLVVPFEAAAQNGPKTDVVQSVSGAQKVVVLNLQRYFVKLAVASRRAYELVLVAGLRLARGVGRVRLFLDLQVLGLPVWVLLHLN